MRRLESWLLSGGMHGILILGATLLALPNYGGTPGNGLRWGDEFHCRFGDSALAVDRSPDVILYGALKSEDPAEDGLDFFSMPRVMDHSCGPVDEELSHGRVPIYPSQDPSGRYFARLRARPLRNIGPGKVPGKGVLRPHYCYHGGCKCDKEPSDW